METPKLLRMDTIVRSTAIDEKTDHIRPLQRNFTGHDLDSLMLGYHEEPMVCRTVPQPLDEWKSTSSNSLTSDTLSSMMFCRCDCHHQSQGKYRAVHEELVYQTQITQCVKSSLLVLTLPIMLSRDKTFTTSLRHFVTSSS